MAGRRYRRYSRGSRGKEQEQEHWQEQEKGGEEVARQVVGVVGQVGGSYRRGRISDIAPGGVWAGLEVRKYRKWWQNILEYGWWR